MEQLSERIRQVSTSRTVHLSGVIDTLRRQGRRIINLGIGEPHEPPSPHVLFETTAAIARGETRYGPVSGIPELREAVAGRFDGYDHENIIITNGSKQALYMALQVLCNPGDEVIIPRPCWVSFCEQIKLAGAKPVLVDTTNHQLDCHAMEQAINAHTKAIIINSPNNPTGAVYPGEDLKKIADLALANDLYLISDEAYEAFVYDGWPKGCLFDFPYIRDRLIIAGSFSKTYCMTGFRIGYAAAPKEIIMAMARLQSHLTGNVCTFSQHGALAATRLDSADFERWLKVLQQKRNMTLEILKAFPCHTPRGAFYVFPDITPCLKTGEDTETLATEILQHANVAVTPGAAFGGEGHIRICYAIGQQPLMEGLKRLAQLLNKRIGATTT